MATIQVIAQTAEVALASGVAKTLLQVVAPTHQRLKIGEWGVFFDGTSNSAEPVQVRLLKRTTAGTMSALTLGRRDTGGETIQSTAEHTATAEPTAGDVIDMVEVHPQGGYEKIFPLGKEIIVGGA